MVLMLLARGYEAWLRKHLASYRQMAFVAGPRQVGKTTTCRVLGDFYLDWDSPAHRRIITAGPEAVATEAGLERLRPVRPVVVFDELHKYRRWKAFLKGYFDLYGDRCRVVVTGSSRLDLYSRGGDSLMGRYFPYRMHPLSVAECVAPGPPGDALTRPPRPISDEDFTALWTHGGFPEPFVLRNASFSRRWQRLRHRQLFREDVRDLTRVQELGQIELLGQLLIERSGEVLVFAHLAGAIHVSQDTVRRWIETLRGLHHGFLVRPWFRNVTKALRKAPKWFLRDWSSLKDTGKRTETFVACHLLKAVEGWTDLGLGDFELRYVRDKQQREVDFLVVRDGKPWMLVEAKHANLSLSKTLAFFQKQIEAPHALQVVLDEPYVDADCFARHQPVVVPARTFLAQLV